MDIVYQNAIFDLFGTLIDDDGRAIPGARALLEGLNPRCWAIVTSAPRSVATALIIRAELPVPSVLISSDDVQHNKPAPDGYRKAVIALGGDVKTTLVVEDSGPGIAAGLAADCDVVAITRGRDPGFARAATYVIGELRNLPLSPHIDGGVTYQLA